MEPVLVFVWDQSFKVSAQCQAKQEIVTRYRAVKDADVFLVYVGSNMLLPTFFLTFHLYPERSKNNASGAELKLASGPRVSFASATFDSQSYNHSQ